MRSDRIALDPLRPGSILQVDPTAQIDAAGKLGVLVQKLSWGAVLWFPGFGQWQIAWSSLEPTGGVAIWDGEGKQITEPVAPLRHHP